MEPPAAGGDAVNLHEAATAKKLLPKIESRDDKIPKSKVDGKCEDDSVVHADDDTAGKNLDQENASHHSWLCEHFHVDENRELLGKGGFGVVFIATHKIDGKDYAIKRIQSSNRENEEMLLIREVKALAELEHINIVRYHTCWIENPLREWQEDWDKQKNFSCSSFSSDSQQHIFPIQEIAQNNDELYQPGSLVNKNADTSSGSSIMFEDGGFGQALKKKSTDYLEEKYKEISLRSNDDRSSPANASIKTSSSSDEDQSEKSSIPVDTSSQQSPEGDCTRSVQEVFKKSDKLKYLYIQTELCRRDTLKDWLLNHSDNPRKSDICQKIFREISLGLEYVHSRNLIHRDLKPSNIYFSMDGLIKIGDFGLVTYDQYNVEQTFPKPVTEDDEAKAIRTDFVGTEMYMSPEQKQSRTYDSKTDIFSLGLIGFELNHPMSLGMEMQRKITDARRCVFPEQVSKEMSSFLQKLLSPLPEDQPSAKEILEDPFINAENFMLIRIS